VDLHRDVNDYLAAVGQVEHGLRLVAPAGQLAYRSPGGRLRAPDNLVRQRLDVVQAVAVAQLAEALGANLAGRHLSVQISSHVLWLAHVAQDELPDIVIALAAGHELGDRYPEPFLEDVACPGADAVPADVGVVNGRAEEANDPVRSPGRDEHGDIQQLAGGPVGVVRYQDISGLQRRDGMLVQDHARSHGQ